MSTVYCQRCSAEMPDYAKFCHRCGLRRVAQSGGPVRDGSSLSSPPSNDIRADFALVPISRAREDDATLPIKREKSRASSVLVPQPPPPSVVYKRQEIVGRRSSSSRAKRYSLVGTCIVLLVGIVVLFASPFLRTRAQVAVPPSPMLTTINATSVFPGGSITLHGANFTPGATVTFSSNGINLALAYAPPPTPLKSAPLSSFGNLASVARQAFLQDEDARVQYDGTFDLALAVPSSWQAESVHKIEAKESSSSRTGSVTVKVLTKTGATLPSLTPRQSSATPNLSGQQAVAPPPQPAKSDSTPAGQQSASPALTPTSVPSPSVSEKPMPVPQSLPQCITTDKDTLAFTGVAGRKGPNPPAQTLIITNCGSAGTVSAVVSGDSLNWLRVSGGGHLASQAKMSLRVSVDAVRSGLSPGPYAGILYITMRTDDGNTRNIIVNVSFTVTSAP